MSDVQILMTNIVAMLMGITLGVVLRRAGMTISEPDLLRFCMTHSISLEQCEIPKEGK